MSTTDRLGDTNSLPPRLRPHSPRDQPSDSSRSTPSASKRPGSPTQSNHYIWSSVAVAPTSAGSNDPSSSKSVGKRKLEPSDSEDPHTKIRRVVRDHISQDPSRVIPMTTVICLHAAVAQKSYGSEKRFLCPPPVVHIEGPLWQMRQQQLSMAVVSESGERTFEQKAPLDATLTASFKFLHVTGSAKSKSFQLSLDIAEPPPLTADAGGIGAARVWATFDSAPVTIISKPSKKTAKTRNISSCILAGGPVSLFNRINSQTVRTKYMAIDHTQLCASNANWSAFNVHVVRPPPDAPPVGGPQPVTYGSEIVLTDTHTGISTAPLIVRKVDKGKVVMEEGGPVSQMQKIALQRVNTDGTRHYLSAAGPLPGGTGSTNGSQSSPSGTHPLLFQAPREREEIKDGVHIVSDEVDDYLCWTIVGISKFQYTFFDAFSQGNTVPESPITPFPTLFTAPTFRPGAHTLELTVSNFFYQDIKTRAQLPLDVYLGSIGPLRLRAYQTAPPGPITAVSTHVQGLPSLSGGSSGGTQADHSINSSLHPTERRYVGEYLHTVVVVDLPSMSEIVETLNDEPDEQSSQSHGPTQKPNRRQQISGRTLPLLFIRSSDGVGYHSGRTVTCETAFPSVDLTSIPGTRSPNVDPGWLAAAQAAAAVDGNSLQGWTLRVM